MNRRFFLKSAGGLALAAPFLPSLWRRMARGQSAPPPPRRCVIFHTPCGCLTTSWFPNVEDGALDAAALAGTTLEPLTPFAGKLLVPRGLRAINQYGGPQSIDPHYQAAGSKLTCALIDNTTRFAQGASFDHEMARQINPAGVSPLVLGAGVGGSSALNQLSYSAADTAFRANQSPQSVYDGLGGLLSAHTGEIEYLRQRKLSVLDAVRDDLQTYQGLDLSAADRQRVQAWQDLVRDTERGVAAAACNMNAIGIDAAAVAAATPKNPNATGVSTTDAAIMYTVGADMMFNLMALSMLCDANRVFVMYLSGYVVFDWDGIHLTHDHDGIAHRTGDFSTGGNCLADCLSMLRQIDDWYARKFLKLVTLLDGLSDGDGTLLDNTATVWLQEFSDGGAFNLNNMPIVIAGSAGGYLKQGRAVNVEGKPIGRGHSEDSCGPGGDGIAHFTGTDASLGVVPINKLYVTLMNAVGCTAAGGGPVTAFGAIDGFTADSGVTNPGELKALKA
jgi:hypothetical protein